MLQNNTVAVFHVKPWTLEKIPGMFIVSWPISCEMKPQKVTDNFLLQEIFNFPFVSLWKSYFLPQTNTSHLIPSVQMPYYRTNLKVSANCENSRYRFAPRVKVFQLQKKRIENHLSQPTSTTFWTASETNREEYCLWLAHFFSLSDTLSSCVWSTDPVFLIQHRFSVKCPSYLFFGITKPKSRKRNFSIWKMVKLKLSCRRKNQLVVSCQVMTNQCCVCGFVSHLNGHETINIPGIFSGVHSFTGKIVVAYCQTYLGMLPQMLHN